MQKERVSGSGQQDRPPPLTFSILLKKDDAVLGHLHFEIIQDIFDRHGGTSLHICDVRNNT